jgi:acetolactate synthase small subunit
MQESDARYLLGLFIEDRVGAIDRVLGLLRRRRFSVRRFSAEATDRPGLLAVEFEVIDAEDVLPQLTRQIEKLADVRGIHKIVSLFVSPCPQFF